MAINDTLPANLNLVIYQGATFTLTLVWKTGSTEGTATPVDLTDYAADMWVRSGDVDVIELTTSNGRITLGGTAGTITLTIDAEDTAALAPTNANYDLLLASPAGVVTALVAGTVVVRDSITV